MVNLKDFIIGNETLYTTAFQQAVDFCYNKGGERFFIKRTEEALFFKDCTRLR